MQNRSVSACIAAFVLILSVGFGCTKMDTTTLGSDLVTVDNINTFADTLNAEATQGFFNNDSTLVFKRDNHIVGKITTDPLFGSTDAAIYVQFKPSFYPFYFGNAGDTVRNDPNGFAGLDSAFVTLSYRGVFGDSSASAIPQTFFVSRIVDEEFRLYTDSVRRLSYQPEVSDILGSAVITPQIVSSKVILRPGRDSVTNQIRIKLNTPAGLNLINTIYNQGAASTGSNNAFYADSLFRKLIHGFAITSTGQGNTLYYVNLTDAKSRLEFHFRKTKNGVRDTVVQSFPFYSSGFNTSAASSSANYIQRNYTGAAVTSPSPLHVYIQTAPGTFANIRIPGLTGYSNRIIHRAFLVAEQDPFDVNDKIFTAPPFLYMDLKDTLNTIPQRYKPLYFDLHSSIPYNPDATGTSPLYHPFPFGNVDVNTVGGNAKIRTDASGNTFARYELNISRYVQHIVSNGYKNYDLRLYAPYNYTYPQYSGTKYLIPFYNSIADGRVRLGSGLNPNHKMKLIVIWSKI